MDTGLYHGLRFFDWDANKKELTDNDFYCKDYDHSEYIILDPDSDRLLPFGFKLPASALGSTLNAALIEMFLVCQSSGASQQITFDPSDWVQTDTADAVYVHYRALNAFGTAVDIKPGIYHLVVDKIGLDGDYRFYSDTFILRKYVASP